MRINDLHFAVQRMMHAFLLRSVVEQSNDDSQNEYPSAQSVAGQFAAGRVAGNGSGWQVGHMAIKQGSKGVYGKTRNAVDHDIDRLNRDYALTSLPQQRLYSLQRYTQRGPHYA